MDQRRLSRIEVFVFDSPEPIHYGMEADQGSRYGILKLTCKGGSSWGHVLSLPIPKLSILLNGVLFSE